MKPSLSFARLLQILLDVGSINYSLIKGRNNRAMLEKFLTDGILDLEGVQQKKITCLSIDNLHKYIRHKFSIYSLDEYVITLEKENPERSEMVRAAGDSKLKKRKILKGFMVNSYDIINCTMGEHPICLPPANGTFLFVNNYKEFNIPSDITVISLEAYQNFRDINQQKHLFSNKKVLFIWRYQNSSIIAEWLKNIPNQYIHFGDFDPKGLHIYISEFRIKLPPERCNFFIPPGIEEKIVNHGDPELFEKQIEKLNQFDFEAYPEIREIWFLLKKYRKGLEQEVFIDSF